MKNDSLREDRELLLLLHLSQLLNLVSAVGGFIVPLLIWQLKKEDIQDMDTQGKAVINFQISLLIYAAISGVLIFVIIGIPLLIIIAIINLVFPIIYGLKAKDGVRNIKYPLTIQFIK